MPSKRPANCGRGGSQAPRLPPGDRSRGAFSGATSLFSADRRLYDKQSAILEIARGRRVLHLGCVGHEDGDGPQRVGQAGQSLHGLLSRTADVVGVDHSAEVVEELARRGVFHNIVVADVQRLAEAPVDGPFEVIVAGDIIEHVSNPGLLLEGIKRFCRADTRIVLTTPHAFGLPNYLRFLLGRYCENAEHVMTFNAPPRYGTCWSGTDTGCGR